MPSLNLRNVDEMLIRKLKAEAAHFGCTMRDLCLMRLDGIPYPDLIQANDKKSNVDHSGQYIEHLDHPLNRHTLGQAIERPPDKLSYLGVEPAVYPGKYIQSEGCKFCGALTGHQKWCKR